MTGVECEHTELQMWSKEGLACVLTSAQVYGIISL